MPGANPYRPGPVALDVADAGQAAGDLVTRRPRRDGTLAEDHHGLLPLAEPQADGPAEQVPKRHGLLAGVLEEPLHVEPDRPPLGEQHPQRRVRPLGEVAVG